MTYGFHTMEEIQDPIIRDAVEGFIADVQKHSAREENIRRARHFRHNLLLFQAACDAKRERAALEEIAKSTPEHLKHIEAARAMEILAKARRSRGRRRVKHFAAMLADETS